MKHSKLYEKYSSIITSGYIEEGQVISMRVALNSNNKSMTVEEREELIGMVQEKELNLTWTQTEKGLRFLKNLIVTPTGRDRKNNPFNGKQTDIINNFKKFTLNGLQDQMNKYGRSMGINRFLPIWRVYCKGGNYFDYIYENFAIRVV